MKKQAVLSLSGGLDSSTLLLRLLCEGYEVTALSFDYGQKHIVELQRAEELAAYINSSGKALFTHQVITLGGLAPLLNSTLVTGGEDVPEGHYAEENMKDTVVPNRNKIFASIIQAVALSKNGPCEIALGIHAGDHSIYLDCRKEFRDADYNAFLLGNWNAEQVTFYTPYLSTDKFGILQDGECCCEKLGLDFNEVYKRTNTSYKPIQKVIEIPHGDGSTEFKHYWCSDYKSASSVERVEAFIKLGRPDPLIYADEKGIIPWEMVTEYVTKLIKEYGK